jgi:protein SCO1/2
MLRLCCILTLLASAVLAGAQPTESAAGDTNQQIHAAKGVVVEVMPAEKQVKIKHEAIPGYMPGMIMPFDVHNTNELAGLQPGDSITFRIITTTNDGWVDRIQKIGTRTNNILPLTGAFHFVRDVEPLNEGDRLPEYHLTNELGQAISTAQYKGQALAITFLFTRCPYPLYCPLMANNFAAVQKQLSSRSTPANWHLLTISFDPAYDTPAVLQQYAKAHDADPQRWTFATGNPVDVRAIGEQFGLVFWSEQSGTISHNLRTVVIDASGRVQKIFTGNDWKPEDLISEMNKAAQRL